CRWCCITSRSSRMTRSPVSCACRSRPSRATSTAVARLCRSICSPAAYPPTRWRPDPMSAERDSDSALARQVQELLGTLPLRPAPGRLAARVLEQLGRRTAAPWWRRQVMQWPMGARLSFGLLGAALMLLSLAGSASLLRLAHPTALAHPVLAHSATPVLAWGHQVLLLVGIVPRLLTALLGLVPVVWLQA